MGRSPRRRDRSKERHWRGVIDRWVSSGRSVRDFCAGEVDTGFIDRYFTPR